MVDTPSPFGRLPIEIIEQILYHTLPSPSTSTPASNRAMKAWHAPKAYNRKEDGPLSERREELTYRSIPDTRTLLHLGKVSSDPEWVKLLRNIVKWHYDDLRADLDASNKLLANKELDYRPIWEQCDAAYMDCTTVIWRAPAEFWRVESELNKLRMKRGNEDSWTKANRVCTVIIANICFTELSSTVSTSQSLSVKLCTETDVHPCLHFPPCANFLSVWRHSR